MIEAGKCPKCGSDDLDYTSEDSLRGDGIASIYFPFSCNKCGFKGREYYNLTFSGFEDDNGNEIK
jgi:hypothetical protein